MNFISPFKKSAYGNTNIYNLVNYFSRHISLYLTLGTSKDNIVSSFDHYLRFNPKPCKVYINEGMYFII